MLQTSYQDACQISEWLENSLPKIHSFKARSYDKTSICSVYPGPIVKHFFPHFKVMRHQTVQSRAHYGTIRFLLYFSQTHKPSIVPSWGTYGVKIMSSVGPRCYLSHGCTVYIMASYINGLVQERHNSIANALELCLSCTNPLIYDHVMVLFCY